MATHSDDSEQQSRNEASQKECFIGSGATAHMCNYKESFADLHEGDPFNAAMGDKSEAQVCAHTYLCFGLVDHGRGSVDGSCLLVRHRLTIP